MKSFPVDKRTRYVPSTNANKSNVQLAGLQPSLPHQIVDYFLEYMPKRQDAVHFPVIKGLLVGLFFIFSIVAKADPSIPSMPL